MSNVWVRPPTLRPGKAVSAVRGSGRSDGMRQGVIVANGEQNGVAVVDIAIGTYPDDVVIPGVRFLEGMQPILGDIVWFFSNGATDQFVVAKGAGDASSGGPVPVRTTYTDWFLPDPAAPGWSTFDVPMSPLVDPSPGGVFWSQQFPLFSVDEGGYIGLQSSDKGRPFKIAISSLFGTVLDAVAGVGGFAAFGPTAADGGPGSSTWIPYTWLAGKEYTMRVAFEGGAPAGKTTAAGPWYNSYVIERDWGGGPGIATLISSQQIPAASGRFGRVGTGMVCFTEHYGGPKPSRCQDIPYTRTWFGSPIGDGATATSVNNHVSTYEGCSNVAIYPSDIPRPGGQIHEMGIH